MITEDYCSYEVAKLLKDKGFDGICTLAYEELNQLKVMMNWRVASGYLPCPTHQMAMKWLREQGIDIIILPVLKNEYNKQKYYIWQTTGREDKASTYEEAVEAALKYCLTELI